MATKTAGRANLNRFVDKKPKVKRKEEVDEPVAPDPPAKKRPSTRSLKNLKKWKKGESGNPGGRPKKLPITETLRALLLEQPEVAHKLLQNMIRMATNKRGGSEAVAAFRALAERAEGKPVQPVDVSQHETLRVVIDL